MHRAVDVVIADGASRALLRGVDPDGDVGGEIGESARSIWETTLDALPRVGAALVIVLVGWLASRGLRWLLRRVFARRRTPSFAKVMSKLVGWIVLTIVVLLAVAVTFPSVRPVDVLAGLGFFSIAVGFAFQDILENSLAGVLLLFRQPFRSGDQIQVLDRSGTVEGITIRETRMFTYDGELVLIPNRDVYKNVIVVHTHQPRHRVHFTVGVAYEADLAEVIDVIERTLDDLPEIDDQPEPLVVVRELGTSTVDVEVMCWTDSRRYQTLRALDVAIRAVKVALDEAGVEMPSEIVALQATSSFRAALQGDAEVTPGGAVRAAPTQASE